MDVCITRSHFRLSRFSGKKRFLASLFICEYVVWMLKDSCLLATGEARLWHYKLFQGSMVDLVSGDVAFQAIIPLVYEQYYRTHYVMRLACFPSSALSAGPGRNLTPSELLKPAAYYQRKKIALRCAESAVLPNHTTPGA
jgi:hypothetical protein